MGIPDESLLVLYSKFPVYQYPFKILLADRLQLNNHERATLLFKKPYK